MVNSVPIIDGDGKPQGSLTTFDDVTELEKKNIQLVETVEQLKFSRDQVQLQNVELERLATCDPMTGRNKEVCYEEKTEQMEASGVNF